MVYGDEPLKLNEYTYAPDISAIMQSGNRYVYVINNPVLYVDKDGDIIVLAIVAGAIIGGIINAGTNVYGQIREGVSFEKLNWASIGVSFAAGAISGGIAGSPIGLLGQVGFNAFISGAESALQDKVYGRDINWNQVGRSAGIGGFAGFFGGSGAQAPKKVVYGKLVSNGSEKFSAVYLTYSNRVTAEAAAKALVKGLTKSSTTVIVTNNVVKVLFEE